MQSSQESAVQVRVDVVKFVPQEPPSNCQGLNTLVITVKHELEEILVDEKNNTETKLGTYPASSQPNPQYFLQLQNLTQNHVFDNVNSGLHDHGLSRQISEKIVIQSSTQNRDDLFDIMVCVNVLQKVLTFVSCNSVTSKEDYDKTCAVCFEELSESGPAICQLPHCSHIFHEDCVVGWLNRHHNSCPLCRQLIDE